MTVVDCVVQDVAVTASAVEVHGHGDSLETSTTVSVSISTEVHPIIVIAVFAEDYFKPVSYAIKLPL